MTESALTWLGHATVLCELAGVRVLTDPLLRRRVAHLVRAHEPEMHRLGDIDVVLISHVHYDHLDLPSLDRLPRTTKLVVPSGAGPLVRRRGFADVAELVAGDAIKVNDVVIQATHADHQANRGPFGVSAPSLGFLLTGNSSISGNSSIYFAGDTDLFPEMSELAPSLEVALLPVAGWGPRLPQGHLDPEGAAQALRLLRPRFAVPIHWGTFWPFYRRGPYPQSLEAGTLFAERAAELAPEVAVTLLDVGERWTVGARRLDGSGFIPTGG
jgi:L-ascorbate metabolism protein UlaG (beta-lactamase superfamily)